MFSVEFQLHQFIGSSQFSLNAILSDAAEDVLEQVGIFSLVFAIEEVFQVDRIISFSYSVYLYKINICIQICDKYISYLLLHNSVYREKKLNYIC